MNIRINSKELRELGIRGTPSVKKIGNGYIIKCPSKEATYREDPKKAAELFKKRQKEFLAETKKKSKDRIANYKKQIKEEKQKVSEIDKVFGKSASKANKQLDEQITKQTKKKS